MSNVISQTLTKNPFQWRLAKIWSTIALTWQHKIYLATLVNYTGINNKLYFNTKYATSKRIEAKVLKYVFANASNFNKTYQD